MILLCTSFDAFLAMVIYRVIYEFPIQVKIAFWDWRSPTSNMMVAWRGLGFRILLTGMHITETEKGIQIPETTIFTIGKSKFFEGDL